MPRNRFTIHIDGLEELQEELFDMKEDIEDTPIYVVGTGKPRAEYAVYLEFGTRNHPPYPFFRPAIMEFRADPERFIEKNTRFDMESIDTASQLITAVAFALERQMKKNVSAQTEGGRSPGVHPEHPKIRTGNLRESITAVRVG